MATQTVLTKGIVEKIWLEWSFLEYEVAGVKQHVDQAITNHTEAVHFVFGVLTWWPHQILSSLEDLDAVGHRVVHGGEYFSDAVVITDEVIAKIEECIDLAPLHNPANLAGIRACQQFLPKLPQVAVFDTAFHQTMQPDHYLYAIPYAYYEKYKVRRYGFHGTSHKYVYETYLANLHQAPEPPYKVITCHVGNGASVAAIRDGKVVETSMGMTPLAGLMMGTRSGSIDPGVMTFLMKKDNMTPQAMEDMLNKKSGLLGVSERSSDLRDILAGVEAGDERCTITLNMYLNSIVKFIWSYVALLNGVDVIILTAGVMERSRVVIKMLMERLSWLGIRLAEHEDIVGTERIISTPDSQIPVVIIHTNEELMIAKETYACINPA